MKKLSQVLYIICILIITSSCKKDEKIIVDLNYTDLEDTLIYVDWANGLRTFDFDIDKDSINDIEFKINSFFSPTYGTENYIEITTKEGYEIVFSDYITSSWVYHDGIDTVFNIDTVMIPKVFGIGDTVFINDNYTEKSIMIYYSYSGRSGPGPEHSSLQYGIQSNEGYNYLCFRNISGNSPKLAWLKVSGASSSGICLYGCRFTDKDSFLVID